MIKNPIKWPNGARCAVAITFDMDADSILHTDHVDNAINMISTLSLLRYGPDVAVPRILDTYKQFDIQQTFFVPGWCIETYPEVVKAMVDDGHEVAHHGYIHESPLKCSREEEHTLLKAGIKIIENATGQRPKGWRAPWYHFTRHSADLLIQESFLYDSSLMGDDIPYILKTDQGELIEFPCHNGMDDWPQFANYTDFNYEMPIKAPSRGVEIFREEFDAIYKYGGLWVSVWHPFVTGRLANWDKIADFIGYMKAKGDVWFAKMGDIAQYVRKCIDDGSYNPRIDSLPYYASKVPLNPDNAE